MAFLCRSHRLSRVDLSSWIAARRWLENFSQVSAIGIGICDLKNRYQCLNPALAAINGIAIESHLSNTIHDVMGEVAVSVEPMLLRVKETRNSEWARVAGHLPNFAERSEWITCHVPLVKPGHRKLVGWGGAVVHITPLARMQTFLHGVMAQQDKRLDTDAVKFVQSLQHCLDDYSSALTTTMTSIVRKAWQTDRTDSAELAPAIEAMDERVIEMNKLMASIEGSLGRCVPSMN